MKTIDANLSIEERRKAFLHELRTTSMDQVKDGHYFAFEGENGPYTCSISGGFGGIHNNHSLIGCCAIGLGYTLTPKEKRRFHSVGGNFDTFYGFNSADADSPDIAQLNDSGKTFAEIADILEEYWKNA